MYSGWADTLEKIEYRQLGRLLLHQRTYQQLSPAWDRHIGEHRAAELMWFMYDGYIAFAASAMRRMVDRSSDSISLSNLLTDLKRPESLALLSRESFLGRFSDHRNLPVYLLVQDLYFSATDGEPDLTADKIDEHLTQITDAVAPVRRLVNKGIAHSDITAEVATTHAELDMAIATFVSVFDKYSILIRCRSIQTHVENIKVGGDVSEFIQHIWP
jgi:hypothetical protein